MTERERICLFAGTTEGRRLARILAPAAETTGCVATEYGEILLDGILLSNAEKRWVTL